MGEYTKEQALKDCIKLWDELARTGMRGKTVALRKIKIYKNLENHCPCCEFAEMDCEKCLLKTVWRRGECVWNNFYKICYCEDYESSPWLLWVEEDNKSKRKIYAKRIADGARKCLLELEGE